MCQLCRKQIDGRNWRHVKIQKFDDPKEDDFACMPRQLPWEVIAPVVVPITVNAVKIASWDEIHSNNNLTVEWFNDFRQRVCRNCSPDFEQIIVSNPFEPTFEYGWRLHDLVSKKIGKPRITLEQARAIWTPES